MHPDKELPPSFSISSSKIRTLPIGPNIRVAAKQTTKLILSIKHKPGIKLNPSIIINKFI